MELSKRLKFIAEHIDKCKSIIDVGTDHGYIPIYAIKNNLCENAIASDINKDPLKKAKLNATLEGVSNQVEIRLGAGLKTIKKGEAQGVIMAGMGGNLIKEILEQDKYMITSFKFLILQPAQNPEVLREYLYSNGYEILVEDLCFDDGIFYELFKVKKNQSIGNTELNPILYEISPMLLKNKHPLIHSYLESKEEKYIKILGFLKPDSEGSIKRKEDIEKKLEYIRRFKEEVR